MLVNNETGVRQPVEEIAALVRERAPRAVMHTDAVQAPQWLDFGRPRRRCRSGRALGPQVRRPEGSRRARRARRHASWSRSIEGGGHEQGRRAGTQNVAGIVAFATALRVTHEQRAEEIARIAALRDRLERGLAARGARAST